VEMAFSEKGAPGAASPSVGPASSGEAAARTVRAPTALHGELRQLEEQFDAAIAGRDVDGAVRTMLALDDTLQAWSGDTTQSDAGTRGRAAMRRMIARLGDLARSGARDPREVVGGFVDALLVERSAARADRRFADADRIRDVLLGCGVEVQDTPEGTVWDLR
jgi:cysteinyl-tRNA synthetase